MEPPDDRPLWDLLKQAPNPRVSGNFTDNVLRRIRLEESHSTSVPVFSWLAQSWKIMSGLTLCAALLAAAILVQEPGKTQDSVLANSSLTPDVSTLLATVDIGNLKDLRDLNSSLDDNDIWLDTTSY